MIQSYAWYIAFLLVGFAGASIIWLYYAGSYGRAYIKCKMLKRIFGNIYRENRWVDAYPIKGEHFCPTKQEIYKVVPSNIYISKDKVPMAFFPDYSALNLSPKDAAKNVSWSNLKEKIRGYIPTPAELMYISSTLFKAREPLPTLEEKPKMNMKNLLIIMGVIGVMIVVFYLLKMQKVI